MVKLIDTSDELLLCPVNNGIKLLTPNKHLQHDRENLIRVSDILNSPINIYFLNSQHIIQNLNETTVSTAGFPSIKKSIGKSVTIAAKKETAERSIAEDTYVLKSQKMHVTEEIFERKDNTCFTATSIKFPWFNANNEPIGIFGCSIAPSPEHPAAEALTLIVKAGLLTSTQKILPGGELGGTYLSSQELKCLRLVVKGMTAKEIAKSIGLSPRTVEHYIESIKIKLNVRTKIELVYKVMNYGF